MFKIQIMSRSVLAAALSVFALGHLASQAVAVAPTGGFLAVLNEQRSFGDSMNSVSFLDADDPSVPLFSVYVGRELSGSNEWEEPTAISVDPMTGDVYVVAFDSGPAGVPDGVGDTQGDLELLRIPFATIYDHWSTNFEGHDVQGESLVSGPAATGIKNALNLDYVTYANTTGDFNTFHSNQFALAGVSNKIGEVARGNGGSFFGFNLEFLSDQKLYLLDDSVGTQVANNPLDDHSVRVLNQVSSSSGAATTTTVVPGGGALNYTDGGYNGLTSESWESTLIEKLNMDGATHSEPRSMTYYDNGAGIRGLWIVEGDFGPGTNQSDKLGFYQLDANDNFIGFRPFTTGGFLAVSDDPFTDPNSNDGKVHEVFVDTNGDLVIVESGFGDAADGIHASDQEPGVIRVSVDYDFLGSGVMQIGAWQQKVFLTFDGGVTTGDKGVDGAGTEFSQHATYDAANNKVYFFSPDTGGSFNTDLHVLDLNTGLTTSYLDWDDSVSLFGGADKDAVAYFFLAPVGLTGDHNNDGKVDAADYVVWRKNPGAFGGAQGYTDWAANFGAGGPGSGQGLAAVPEPASVMMLILGLAALAGCRRSR